MNFSVQVSGGRRRSSGIPRSRGSSREASPNRYGMRSYNLRASAERTIPKPPPASRPHLTENILKQSREAENALADALVSFCCSCNPTTNHNKHFKIESLYKKREGSSVKTLMHLHFDTMFLASSVSVRAPALTSIVI